VGVTTDLAQRATSSALAQRPPLLVIAPVAVGSLVDEQGGYGGLAAGNAGVLGLSPAADAKGAAVRQAHGRMADPSALAAFLDDLGIARVAAVTDSTLGPHSNDVHFDGAAASAHPVLAGASVAVAADPSFLA
jgi:hypothetical protein